MKSYTDLEQSKKLVEILPIESADMHYSLDIDFMEHETVPTVSEEEDHFVLFQSDIPCWSLSALLSVLPEINGIPLRIEKVKAEDGYDGYYYHIEYKGIVLIPYSQNPVDACVKMIEKLNELKML